MPETISTTFDPASLPDWAQRSAAVRWLARRDHGFRAEVFRCSEGNVGDAQMQAFCRREAARRYDDYCNS